MIQDFIGGKVGKYLKYWREKRGLTVQSFAELLELDPSFISRLEKGEYHTLKLNIVEQISFKLKMPLGDFLWKCQILDDRDRHFVPELEYYFREKFQYPDNAVEEIKTFLKFIDEKYKTEIKKMKKAHEVYWKEL